MNSGVNSEVNTIFVNLVSCENDKLPLVCTIERVKKKRKLMYFFMHFQRTVQDTITACSIPLPCIMICLTVLILFDPAVTS